MEDIKTTLANIQEKVQTVPAEALLTKLCAKLTPPAKETVENLWGMMVQLYGHKWVSSYGATPDPLGVWAASLKGITPEMIKSGLGKLITRGYEWPPSAPEFAGLCRPSAEDFDIPDFDECSSAISQFRRNKEKRLDPFTYTMYLSIRGFWELDRMPAKEWSAEMKRYYRQTVDRVVSGGELFVQPDLIGKPLEPAKAVDSATAEKHIEAMKKAIGD